MKPYASREFQKKPTSSLLPKKDGIPSSAMTKKEGLPSSVLPLMNKHLLALKQKKIPPKSTFMCGPTRFEVDARYEFIKMMGGGAYGVVAAAKDNETGKKVAIKKIPNAFEDLVDAKRIYREIKLLKFFNHEHIIKLFDIIRPDHPKTFNDIYIITELMETDLHRVIYSKQPLSEEHIQYFIYQILKATQHMHSANVIHRDMKPSNVLLNKQCDVKICDMGLGRGFEEEDESKTEYVVTRWYRAPEVILNASDYSKAIDVWAVGCIFAELLGRTAIFPGESYLDQIQRIVSVLGTPTSEDTAYISNEKALQYLKSLPKRSKQSWAKIFPKSPPLAIDLLGKMLIFNPNLRYTVDECLDHPYFADLRSEDENLLADTPFDWGFDNFKLTAEKLRELIYKEALKFHPL